MFENPRRGRQAKNFTANVPKILVLKSSSEQIFSRKLPLGAPELFTEVEVASSGYLPNSWGRRFSLATNKTFEDICLALSRYFLKRSCESFLYLKSFCKKDY